MAKYTYLLYICEGEWDLYGTYSSPKQAKLGAADYEPVVLDGHPLVKPGVVVESFNPRKFFPKWQIRKHKINSTYSKCILAGTYEMDEPTRIAWTSDLTVLGFDLLG